MDERRAKTSRWIAGAALFAAAALIAVRIAPSHQDGAPPQASKARSPESPPTEVKRFQVPVTASQPSKGPADAIVTIVEWCDLLSPECKAADKVVDSVLNEYGDSVRLVFRNYISGQTAPVGEEFARIAFEQAGKFWEARDLLREGSATPSRAELEAYANRLGLDWKATSAALEAHTHTGHVVADRLFAQMFEVQSAPAFFVNGRRVEGPASQQVFTTLIDDEIKRATKLVEQGIPKAQVYAELTKNGAWKDVHSTRPN
jgi:protein-disulfide isomerase